MSFGTICLPCVWRSVPGRRDDSSRKALVQPALYFCDLPHHVVDRRNREPPLLPELSGIDDRCLRALAVADDEITDDKLNADSIGERKYCAGQNHENR